MSKLCLRLCVSVWVLFVLAAPVSAQGSINVTAEVDRTTISTDDLLTLTLTVAGDYQQLGEPQMSLMTGFNVVGSSRSSQFSMVNGAVTARTVFSYRLQPTGPGTFTIDRLTVPVNGSNFQTEPITIQVVQGEAPTPTPDTVFEPSEAESSASPGASGLAGQDLYVAADVDNPRPFIGQQIIYRFRLYQAVNLLGQPRLEWPVFSGFWAEDLAPNNVFEQDTAGRRYRVTEVRQALFPTVAGQTTIQPTTLTIPGDFFSRDVILETEPVLVNVQQLPHTAPDGFLGAVGQFDMTAVVEPVEARVNEPVTLIVHIQGAGNVANLPDPTEEAQSLFSDWRVYDPQTTTTVGQNGDTIQGEKLFERLLVPRIEGDLNIPAFALVYFDPGAGEYHRIETDPLVVHVAPGESVTPGLAVNGNGKQDITLLGSDIRHIKAAPPTLATHRTPLLEQPAYWLGWGLPPLAVAGAWIWERRRRRLSSDLAYARAQGARRSARKRLAQARKQARQDEDDAHAIVARALTEYLGDKFNLPSAGLTREDIRQTLVAQNAPDALIDRSLNCLDWADSGRFAPVAAGRSADELIDAAQSIIAELEHAIEST
jgi:hypothetical protein